MAGRTGIDVEVRRARRRIGAPDELRQLGRQGLKVELDKAILQAVRPTREAVKDSAYEKLPKRGGLAELVAESSVAVFSSARANRLANVTVRATNAHAIGAMDKGKLRHPVFGQDRWVDQRIKSRWFSGPIRKTEPAIRSQLTTAVESIAARFNHSD